MSRWSATKGGSRSRSLAVSIVSGIALILLAFAVFAVASQARSLSNRAELSVQTVEDLRVASIARSEISSATRVAEVAPSETVFISTGADNAMAALDSLNMSLDDTTAEILAAAERFDASIRSQSDLLGAPDIDIAALVEADTATEESFSTLADLLRSEQLDAVSNLESDNDLLNLIATLSTFIVAFVVPSAALFVFQALRSAPRETRELRLDRDRVSRRSQTMAAAVSKEASELRAKISADPTAVSMGTIQKSLRRFEHISASNGAPSTVRSELVEISDVLAQTIDDLNARFAHLARRRR